MYRFYVFIHFINDPRYRIKHSHKYDHVIHFPHPVMIKKNLFLPVRHQGSKETFTLLLNKSIISLMPISTPMIITNRKI